jgi:uncharacterized lipoprotein YmbA
MKYPQLISIVFSSWLLSACAVSSTAPSGPNEYLLMDSEKTTEPVMNTSPADVQLLPIKVAPYLAGNDIILVSEQGEVHRSQQNLWAEPLSPQLHRITLQRLAVLLPNINFFGRATEKSLTMNKLNIEINEFYADLSGITHISGRWQLFAPSGELLIANEFSEQSTLKQSGYPTLVNTLASSWIHTILAPLSTDIAQSIHPTVN